MKSLRLLTNSIPLLFILIGCTTSSFKIKDETASLTELIVTPDRIALQCQELDEDPDIGAYGFMVHILDDKNTVTTSALIIRPDKESCERHIRRITHILKNGKKIYIGNRHSLSSQPRTNKEVHIRHTFPGHGSFSSNGRSLEFEVIANEKGQCYGPMYSDNEPCPQFPFPIKNHSK